MRGYQAKEHYDAMEKIRDQLEWLKYANLL